MQILTTRASLQSALQPQRAASLPIALVPTMGNLHAGHASLIRRARTSSDCVVASVFVNPLQFGPTEDFERYPRTLQADAQLLEAQGADFLFAPSVSEMYPGGYPPVTTVRVNGLLGDVLEAEFRPGHFEGVATVVHLLFNHVRPDLAIFGEKDYQQLAVIRRMTLDLGLPVRVEGAPTLREADGLAMSSRNQYLSDTERPLAGMIYAALQSVASGVRADKADFNELCEEQLALLREAGFNPQYLALRAPDLSLPKTGQREFVVLAAAHLGNTRLIDNLQFQLGDFD